VADPLARTGPFRIQSFLSLVFLSIVWSKYPKRVPGELLIWHEIARSCPLIRSADARPYRSSPPHLHCDLARCPARGVRSVAAESVLLRHQLLILNRSRRRASHLRISDRLIVGFCSLFVKPARLVRAAMVLKPSTLLNFHRSLVRTEISAAVFTKAQQQAGTKRARGRHHPRHHEMKQPESQLGLPANRRADQPGVRHFYK